MRVVTVSHVEKYYGNQGNITKALNDISFAVEKQEFTAVMGASGSGKTTLLNVISTIDAVSAGNIEINGNGICELRENELAEFRKKELGFIFQDFNLLDTLTLQENIALPLTLLKKRAGQIDEQINALAEILQIQDILEKNNITIYSSEEGDAFNPIKQRALKKVKTPVEELHGKVAESMSSGYEYLGKPISPEKVSVYVYEKPSDVEGEKE